MFLKKLPRPNSFEKETDIHQGPGAVVSWQDSKSSVGARQTKWTHAKGAVVLNSRSQ